MTIGLLLVNVIDFRVFFKLPPALVNDDHVPSVYLSHTVVLVGVALQLFLL